MKRCPNRGEKGDKMETIDWAARFSSEVARRQAAIKNGEATMKLDVDDLGQIQCKIEAATYILESDDSSKIIGIERGQGRASGGYQPRYRLGYSMWKDELDKYEKHMRGAPIINACDLELLYHKARVDGTIK